MLHNKTFEVSSRKTKEIVVLNEQDLRILTGFFTGHSGLSGITLLGSMDAGHAEDHNGT